jgi:hypothetical protein
MHGSMWRELETEAPGNGHRSEAACQGKPGEKWLRDLTSDNAAAPAPDPTGHFIIGFGDGSLPIAKAGPIRVKPEIYEGLDKYIASHPVTAARIHSVLKEIEGFESTNGLELLATVHWVMTHDATAMANSGAHEEVRRWNQRKSSLFTQPHVESAWLVVHERGLAATP